MGYKVCSDTLDTTMATPAPPDSTPHDPLQRLRAWLTPGSSELARRFARWSAIGSLALGMLGQWLLQTRAAACPR